MLQTVFQFLDHSDVIELNLREDSLIRRLAAPDSVDALQEIPEESDLCIRAAILLQSRTSTNSGVDITLTKNYQ